MSELDVDNLDADSIELDTGMLLLNHEFLREALRELLRSRRLLDPCAARTWAIQRKRGAHRLPRTDTFLHPILEGLHHGLLPVQRRVLSRFQKLLRFSVGLEYLRCHDGDFEVLGICKVNAICFWYQCIDFPNAKYLDVAIVAAKVLEAHANLKEFRETAQHPTLHREKPVVHALEYGMRECIRMRKPVSAAPFLDSSGARGTRV